MRRSPEPKGVEQEPEPRLGLLLVDTEGREDAPLHVHAVHADAAGAELPPVEDEVVGQRADSERIRLQEREVLGVRHGERMVGRLGSAVVADPVEERKVHDPHVARRSLPHRRPTEVEAELSHHRARTAVLVGHGEDQVARRSPSGSDDPGLLVIAEEPRHRRLQCAARRPVATGHHPGPDQTLGPEPLGPLHQGVQP